MKTGGTSGPIFGRGSNVPAGEEPGRVGTTSFTTGFWIRPRRDPGDTDASLGVDYFVSVDGVIKYHRNVR